MSKLPLWKIAKKTIQYWKIFATLKKYSFAILKYVPDP